MGLLSWAYLVACVLILGAALLLSRPRLLALGAGALLAFGVSLLFSWQLSLLPLGLGVLVTLLLFLLPSRRRLTTLEAMVGMSCTVTERISPLTGGQVSLGDGLWAARALSADTAYEVGTVLTVVAIEGVKLICA